MEIKIAAIMIQAAVLCGLLYAFGRDEADYDFQKVVMVVAVISLINFGVEALLTAQLGYWVLLVELGVIVFFVEKFCWLPWKRAALVGVILMAVNAGMAFGAAALVHKMDGSVDKTGGTVVQRQQNEGLQVAHQLSEDLARTARQDAENYKKQLAEEARGYGIDAVPARAAPSAPVATTPVEMAKKEPPQEQPPERVREGEPSKSQPDWNTAREQLVVTAKMSGKGGDIVAVVNDRMVSRGEKVAVRYGDYRYVFQLSVLTQDETKWDPVRADPLP